MAPIVTSWSSLDYENGQQQRSNKLKQQQQQSSLSVYQPTFRLRQNSVSVTPPSINSSLKSYGSVSSFESADPFASLLASTISASNSCQANGGNNPGPTKPPRALYPPSTSSTSSRVGSGGTGNRQHPPPLSIGAGPGHSKFHQARHPQGQILCANRSKSHSDLVKKKKKTHTHPNSKILMHNQIVCAVNIKRDI
jgi:hypothetical protein